MSKKLQRTSQSLRDVLFDEIEELRSGNGDTARAQAVANLSRQIISTAKVELDFHREIRRNMEAGLNTELGQMQLGSPGRAASADDPATEA